MRSTHQPKAALLATIVAVATVAMVAGFSGMAISDQHEAGQASDMSENADFTVEFPHATDHYPGSMNEENGSIQYFASGADAFSELDAEDGVFFDYIQVGADWIDYSACDTPNTEAFGIDRGGNNDGIEYDEDLLQYQERNNFHDGGIDIWFYDWSDFAGDPPYMAPEDQVVAAQGQGSSAGACLTVTDEPGWYQVDAFVNGTVADNGPDQQPSDSAEQIGMHLQSDNYLYVCDCDNREEAEEQLGPAPGDGDPEPEPEEPEEEQQEGGETEEEQEQEEQQETGEEETGADDGTEDSEEPQEGEEETGAEEEGTEETEETGADDAIGATPTVDDGPGLGALGALAALLAGTLLAYRRP